MKGKILLVDDDPTVLEVRSRDLIDEGYTVLTAATGQEAIRIAEREELDVVVCDVRLPDINGIDTLRRIKAQRPDIRTIIITGYASETTPVEAIKLGVNDYLLKPFEYEEFINAVNNNMEHLRLQRGNETLKAKLIEANRALQRELGQPPVFMTEFIGESDAMQKVHRAIMKAAPTNISVIICGETGVGKELVARAIHSNSSRREKPFIAVNCAAIPHELAESELFGHEKGAFTSATSQRLGKFEVANEGTIFLDEIGDLAPEIQSKLLRVLEGGTFQRVGGNKEIRVDVRLIAATNKDLLEEVRARRFREDLFYRVRINQIDVPPLRERKEDIPLLAKHFLAQFVRENPTILARTLSDEAIHYLLTTPYHWAGNVRELKNMIEHAAVNAEGECIDISDFSPPIGAGTRGGGELKTQDQSLICLPVGSTLEEIEREAIFKTLEAYHWNKVQVAKQLRLGSTNTLNRKIEKYGLCRETS
ncbi:sigma-54-dependent Fis family transcriptional regulator [Candidatus Poribacteria bacterium]|nr:sigma-54-dependent Fis family transcriptional regulator [Candidatus Poribacteria bacterium]